ncbi:trypsin-like peptidase domain-containing protein [Pontiella sp.]|uniref:trypsin-like peptidase domain-containing protein n=1 Tax=Pontiella sp. TaxID=2837462 RepID=UPI003567C950
MKSTRRQAIRNQASILTLLAGASGLNAFASPADGGKGSSFGFDEEQMKNVLVNIDLEEGTVCGFIANMDGKPYVLTNTQLISGHHRFTLSTLSGTMLRPTRIELSATRDLARIQVESDAGLKLAAAVSDDTEVMLAGFTSSQSSYSETGGIVQNANEERFDITADFGKENCGSPILTAKMEVCGIASNIDYYTNSGISWGPATRNFIYRIEGDSWFSPNWKQYDTLFGKPLRDADSFRQQVYGLASNWMKNLKSRIETEEDVPLEVERWIKQHNGMVGNLEDKRGSKKKGTDPNKSFQKDFSDSCNALVDMCEAKARSLTFVAEQKNATPFTSNQFLWRSRELLLFVRVVRAFEESKSNMIW